MDINRFVSNKICPWQTFMLTLLALSGYNIENSIVREEDT